jgi:hypothetical protein
MTGQITPQKVGIDHIRAKRWNTLTIADYRSHDTAPGEKHDMLAEEIMYR